MTRLLGFVVHNWPLKVAAVVLASLLYGVLVLARDAQQIPVTVPIEPRGQPEDAILLSPLGQVTRVRFIAPPDVTVNSSSFIASVNLAGLTPGEGTRTVGVEVTAIDQRIRPLEWEPQQIRVTLDQVDSRRVPIEIDQGEVPPGLDVRPPEIEPATAIVTGAASVVERVDHVVGTVSIDATGIDIDRDVELSPVDAAGVAIQQVDVEPSSARVRITVIKDGETKSLPVHPVPTGQPAPGFELASVVVDPLSVTVGGDGEQLADLTRIDTLPIPIDGATATIDRPIELALPPGIVPVSEAEVRAVVTFRPVTGNRNITAGVVLVGALSDRSYELSVQEVEATVGGSVADLARLDGSTFRLEALVAGLPPGRHEVELTADLPAGLALLAASPPTVFVTIGSPPSPSPSLVPTVAPSPSP